MSIEENKALVRYLPDNEMVGIRAICNNDLDFF